MKKIRVQKLKLSVETIRNLAALAAATGGAVRTDEGTLPSNVGCGPSSNCTQPSICITYCGGPTGLC